MSAPTPLIFDRSCRLARPALHLLLKEMWAFHADPRPGTPTPDIPRGDGHPVLVIPPFLSSDYITRYLRRYLDARGYQSYGWALGRNLGPSSTALEGIAQRVARLTEQHGRKVSMIGLSLDGVLAREVAKQQPAKVRRVITLCSSYHLPMASNIELIFRPFAAYHKDAFAHLLPTVAEPPPVPTTSVYSRSHGIVSWQSCLDADRPGADDVDVRGAHSTIGRNPYASAIVTERLSRPETSAAPRIPRS